MIFGVKCIDKEIKRKKGIISYKSLYDIYNDDFVYTIVFNEIEDNLKKEDILKNPYREGKVLRYVSVDLEGRTHRFIVIRMVPVYPQFFWIGLFPIVLNAIWPSLWLLIPGLLIFSGGILFTSLPSKIALWYRLRKEGYTGKIKFMSQAKTLDALTEVS